MNFQCKRGQFFHIIVTIFIVTTIVNCTEIRKDLPSNHKETIAVPSVSSSLKMESRVDLDDFNIVEKSKNSPIKDKSDKQPIILGMSKVAIVYSEGKSSFSDKDKNAKAPRVVYPHKETLTSNDKIYRDVKVSSRDSYLDALEHSQTRNDRRDEVIIETKPKISKLIRRDYNEGPIYRHPHENYPTTPSPSSSLYNFPQRDIHNRPITKNLPRISYGLPTTPEPFFPTPSDSYSLPVHSFPNFNDNHQKNNDFYPSPKISYGSPIPHTEIYNLPNNNYNKAPSTIPQNSYGPPTTVNNGYPHAGITQQVYGPPATSYGSPYATQDFSQHLPSLPSMDFIWPFALKLNAFTLAKILLKLLIFKMIVKFIGLICLLLFIPKLEIVKKIGNNDDSDDSDDSRKFKTPDSNRLNILTAFVTSSIEQYEKKKDNLEKKADKDCTSFTCRMRKFITHEESWNDYARLFKNYATEETNYENEGTRTNRLDT